MDELLIELIRRTFALFYGVLFILGLSNVVVLVVVAVHRHMRSVTNILILNLCLADLFFVSTMPLMIPFRLKQNWTFGLVVCKVYFIAESLTRFVSVFFVGVLSMDRYVALCYTAWCKKYRNQSTAVVISIVGWTITAVLMTPMLIYSSVIEVEPGVNMCTIKWPRRETDDQADERRNLTYEIISGNFSVASDAAPASMKLGLEHYFAIYTFLFCFAIPAVVIIFFYCKIVLQMLAAGRRAARLQHARRTGTYKKVTRMVLTIVTFYFVCWSPYWIMSFVSTFVFVGSPGLPTRIVFNILHMLPYLNCSINPLLYTFMTQSFRDALTTTITRCKFCSAVWSWMKNSSICRRSSSLNVVIPGSSMVAHKKAAKDSSSFINENLKDNNQVKLPLITKKHRIDKNNQQTLETRLTETTPWQMKKPTILSRDDFQNRQSESNSLQQQNLNISTAI